MPTSHKSLDEKFGLCVKPSNINSYEKLFSPFSMFLFNSTSAKDLKSLFENVNGKFYLSHALYTSFTLLWLVNDSGQVLIALEEIVSGKNFGERYPLPHLVSKSNTIRSRRLGHPSLVRGNPARIGGELNYEPESGKWYLTNRSGRFGLNLGRSEEQLNEVAKLFKAEGLNVVVKFL